jgi:hypothetical protein
MKNKTNSLTVEDLQALLNAEKEKTTAAEARCAQILYVHNHREHELKQEQVRSSNLLDRFNASHTVLSLAIERGRIKVNKAAVEYDEARAELSRLTTSPAYALGESPAIFQKIA